MFAKIKRKLLEIGKRQVKVIPLESRLVSTKEKSLSFHLISLLPRKAYFETYKSYPLSIGKDINKVASVDAKQVTPYQAKWSTNLIIKQQEQYLVYYFSLLPKYEHLLDSMSALFVMPATAQQLLSLAKKGQTEVALGFTQDSKQVWMSSLTAGNDSIQSTNIVELIQLNLLKAFFNKDILVKLEQKFTRWNQIKTFFSLMIATGLYFSISAGYLMFVEHELTTRQEKVRPVITELFQSKTVVEKMLGSQKELHQVLKQSSETLDILQLIETIHDEMSLQVDSIEVKGSTVTIKATSDSASRFFEKLLSSELVSNPEFKSDIKKTGKEQSQEKFTLQFTWLGKLWSSK